MLEQVADVLPPAPVDVLPEETAAAAGQAEFQDEHHLQVRLPVDELPVGPAAAAEIPAKRALVPLPLLPQVRPLQASCSSL